MPQFIRVTSGKGQLGRLNVDTLQVYWPHAHSEYHCDDAGEGRCLVQSDLVLQGVMSMFGVTESPEDLDRMINPTGTP